MGQNETWRKNNNGEMELIEAITVIDPEPTKTEITLRDLHGIDAPEISDDALKTVVEYLQERE